MSGSTGHARWAAGSGQADAASRRSRRTGGPAHSLRAARGQLLWPRRGLPLCSLRLFLEAACFQPNLARIAGDSPQLPPRPACSRRCPGGAGRQHQPWAWVSPGPNRGMRQPEGSPTPASSSSSKLHICRRVCCSHGDRQASEPLGRGAQAPPLSVPPLHGQTDVVRPSAASHSGVSRPSNVLPHKPTNHQNILRTPGSQQPLSHPLAGSSPKLLTWCSRLLTPPPDHPPPQQAQSLPWFPPSPSSGPRHLAPSVPSSPEALAQHEELRGAVTQQCPKGKYCGTSSHSGRVQGAPRRCRVNAEDTAHVRAEPEVMGVEAGRQGP